MLMCEEPANKEVHFHSNHEEMLPSKHKCFVSLISATLRKAIFKFEMPLKLLPALYISVRHTDSKLSKTSLFRSDPI